jgi:hypothetical protein
MSSTLQIRIFDGTRQLFSAPAQFLITITDGNKTQRIRNYYPDNDITFDLPFFDNFGDNYTVLVWADGYQQAGFTPVTLSEKTARVLDIMLIPKDPGFNFATAAWDAASASYPFLGGDVDNATAATRYSNLMENSEKVLACLLNLGEAMSQISLPDGSTPLNYIKQLCWTAPNAPAQDRFFAWCDPRLIDQVKAGAAAGEFAVELNPGLFHPGATSSWKQIQFGEANVQLTFHEGTTASAGGINCIMVEPDIDYYQDLGAHALLEVVANALTHSLTEPAQVYVLRWIAAQAAEVTEFAPLYTITS